MATVKALIFLVLAMAEASLDLHQLAKHPNIYPYQDPSRFIWNKTDAYLLRVSAPVGTKENITQIQTPCVRSRYLANTTTDVERTLEVYNKTDSSGSRSINISLTVKKEAQTFLDVNVTGQSISIMSYADKNIALTTDYRFLVLFSDSNCLILAETLETERVQRKWLRCSMWLPKHRITKPPKCCLFVFDLLCAYMDESIDVFDKSCLKDTAKSSRSGRNATA
uniref:Lipocalin n=1 Tax=Rhipicephalus zambeziensis TaxID=60191 RepID=A0A224YKU2_9ACAR